MKYLAAIFLLLPWPAIALPERCDGAIDAASARSFAQGWIADWNSHDITRIMKGHTDDFEMLSPGIITAAKEPSGKLRGKDKVQSYWETALKAMPNLRFELLGAYGGIGSIAINYQAVGRYPVVEVLEFNRQCEMVRGNAIRGAPAP